MYHKVQSQNNRGILAWLPRVGTYSIRSNSFLFPFLFHFLRPDHAYRINVWDHAMYKEIKGGIRGLYPHWSEW